MARFCKHCGRQVNMETKICPGCGKALKTFSEDNTEQLTPKFCPKCGKLLMEGALFCVNCGTAIRGKTVKTEKAEKAVKPESPEETQMQITLSPASTALRNASS